MPLLWFADEQCADLDPAPLRRSGVQVLCNRYDVWRRLEQAGVAAYFNDFDTSGLPPQRTVCHRIAKEKAVVHHLLNRSARLLAPGGILWLAGARDEGIRSALDRAGRLLGGQPEARKLGPVYRGRVERIEAPPGPSLDDCDYTRLRPVAVWDGVELLSKPGLFGWDRIDRGSALLAAHLPAFLGDPPPPAVLDLGCGHGHLAVAAWRCGVPRLLATDNNAAALATCRANFEALGIPGEVRAGDCGDTLTERVPALLCNPPFHRGFEASRELTVRFLAAATRLLQPHGRALFVVNRFIPLPRLAGAYFRHVDTVTEADGFRLVALNGPRPT